MKQLPRDGASVAYARVTLQAGGVRILCMDDRVPHRELGPEYAAVNDVVTRLTTAGHHVTLASMEQPLQENEHSDIAWDIELADVMTAGHYVFRELLPACDVVWIRGRQNMQNFLRRMWNMYEKIPPIVYEAGSVSAEEESASALAEDVALCEAADVILVPSEGERELLSDKNVGDVHVVAVDDIGKVLVEVGTSVTEPSFNR